MSSLLSPPSSFLFRSIIVVLGGLLVQLYFGGSLPRSPYPNPQQAAQLAQQRSRSRSRSSQVSPEDAARPSAPPAMLATL